MLVVPVICSVRAMVVLEKVTLLELLEVLEEVMMVLRSRRGGMSIDVAAVPSSAPTLVLLLLLMMALVPEVPAPWPILPWEGVSGAKDTIGRDTDETCCCC